MSVQSASIHREPCLNFGSPLILPASFSLLPQIGDYRNMPQVGGTYPIGEVFSESKHLKGVNGCMTIFGYPSLQKQLVLVDEPMRLEFKQGVLQFSPDSSPPILPLHSTPEFTELLHLIRSGEGEISLREFGMGLNRGMSRERTVADIFAFERQHGLHISLGKKHNVFKADGIKGKQTTFHIDVFVDVHRILVDGVAIFENNEWTSERRFDFQGNPLKEATSTSASAAAAAH
jgi:aminopeptidase